MGQVGRFCRSSTSPRIGSKRPLSSRATINPNVRPRIAKYGSLGAHRRLPPVIILLLIRELAKHLEGTPLIAVCANPGFCKSALRRNLSSGVQALSQLAEMTVGRTTEEGSRMLVWSAVGNVGREDELRGAYVNLCKVDEPSDFIVSEIGQEVQKRVWVCGTRCLCVIRD